MVVIVFFFVAVFVVVRVVAILAKVIKASCGGECCRSCRNIHSADSITVEFVKTYTAVASICGGAQVGNH